MLIFYDIPGAENGLTKFHDFPQPVFVQTNTAATGSVF